jgi:oligosaccharide repeat unit polymerase
VILMGALSGSRSSLLNIFLMQFIVYHYVRSNVSVAKASLLAVALMLTAMTLGVVRNTIRYSAGEFSTAGASTDTFSFAAFTYGVYPLEVIATTQYMPLAEGSTFLSAVTNVIPREIWPQKPDTGGVFFTENYLEDAWQGYSNITPTFLGEWLINFGWFAGIIGYMTSFGLLLYFTVRYYFYVLREASSDSSELVAIDVVIYVHFLLAVVGLMVGELTNVVVTLVVSQLLPLLGIRQYMKWTSPRPAPAMPARRDPAPRPELASRA